MIERFYIGVLVKLRLNNEAKRRLFSSYYLGLYNITYT